MTQAWTGMIRLRIGTWVADVNKAMNF